MSGGEDPLANAEDVCPECGGWGSYFGCVACDDTGFASSPAVIPPSIQRGINYMHSVERFHRWLDKQRGDAGVVVDEHGEPYIPANMSEMDEQTCPPLDWGDAS